MDVKKSLSLLFCYNTTFPGKSNFQGLFFVKLQCLISGCILWNDLSGVEKKGKYSGWGRGLWSGSFRKSLTFSERKRGRMGWWLIFYRVLFPVLFLFFLPGLLWKLWKRPGWKATFAERFGIFSRERQPELAGLQGCIWIHAVSVGETVLALSLQKKMALAFPEKKFVISTTTTTGQALAREKAPEGVSVIFCPLDFWWFVRKVFRLLRPSMLVIMETEIWPELIYQAGKFDCKLFLANARLSDHSVRGYRKFAIFFRPLLAKFTAIGAQSQGDADRFCSIYPGRNIVSTGNLKFDQKIPETLNAVDYRQIFGPDESLIFLAASTHPNEEALMLEVFGQLKPEIPQLKMVLVPRHAERGKEVEELLQAGQWKYLRRSQTKVPTEFVDVLLADTTGEMLALMAGADLVLMGKSFAGQDEGHNLLEPALLGKAIVTGATLRNFREILRILQSADAVETVEGDEALSGAIRQLCLDGARRRTLAENARQAALLNSGATDKLIALMKAS